MRAASRRLKAAILATPDPVAAGLVDAWRRGGHDVASIHLSRSGSGAARIARDRWLASYSSDISITAQAAAAGHALRFLDDRQSWLQFLAEQPETRPDFVLSLMFMARIPVAVLQNLTVPVLNLHPALLPAYRGATPFISMLLDGTASECSGLTLHLVEEHFDSGPIVAQAPVPYDFTRRSSAHLDDLIERGAALLTNSVPALLAGRITARPQGPLPQNRRCHGTSELVLKPGDGADDVRRRLDAVGPFHPLKVEGVNGGNRASRFLRKLGDARGEPPRVGWLTIEMDARDARVRLRRSTALSRSFAWWREMRDLAKLRKRSRGSHGSGQG